MLPFMKHVDICDRDGFPLLEIEGETYCSVEYTDGLIGGQHVQSVIERKNDVILVFSNGWEMPLTCPCCGGTLHRKGASLEAIDRVFQGRELQGFRHGEWVGKESPPRRHPVFALLFAGDEHESVRTIQVHLDSVRRLRQIH